MISVCLASFGDGPWTKGLSDQIDIALKSSKKHTFKIDKTRGLPKKKYDIIFLCGIRVLYKMKIDINYLRNFAQLVIEFGDTEQDPRDAGADLYFFFTPTDIGIEGRKLLPKFVNEDELYSEQDEKVTIYVDHYGHQTTSEQELSRAAMKNVFYQLSLFDFEFDFFFHSQNGVEKNPKNITLPSDQKHDYKKLDFAEIAKYYRKSHIFFLHIEKHKVC